MLYRDRNVNLLIFILSDNITPPISMLTALQWYSDNYFCRHLFKLGIHIPFKTGMFFLLDNSIQWRYFTWCPMIAGTGRNYELIWRKTHPRHTRTHTVCAVYRNLIYYFDNNVEIADLALVFNLYGYGTRAITRCRPNAGLRLDQRRRRWPNLKPTLHHHLAFAGIEL